MAATATLRCHPTAHRRTFAWAVVEFSEASSGSLAFVRRNEQATLLVAEGIDLAGLSWLEGFLCKNLEI
jgi:hypothetical protein